MSGEPVLSFKFRLGYDGFQLALAHDMRASGITALFGHSGSGKTTVLRVLAGLEAGADGTVTFDGTPWQTPAPGPTFVPTHARGIGYVFQDARLFPHLTVAGNLAYAARRSRGRAGADFETVTRTLDLGPLLERQPDGLSGGERQRVAVARALLTRPRLLLMDEPLSALDQKRKNEILPYIARLPGEFGVPVIYVTHSVDEVAYLADTMIVLSKGRKIADGPVTETLARLDLGPATGRFEAGVVLAGRIIAHDNRFQLSEIDVGGAKIAVPVVAAAVGSPVRLRVRARDVILATERPNNVSSRNILEGTVIEIVEEPDTAFAETLIEVGAGRLRARLTRRSVAELGLAPGARVYCMVKSTSLVGGITAER